MLIIPDGELESQGYHKSSLKLFFKDKQFKEAGCFSKIKLYAAAKFCQELLDQGIDCLLVEHVSYFTLWQQIPVEELSEAEPIHQNSNEPIILEHQTTLPANSNEQIDLIVNSKISNTPENKTAPTSVSNLPKEFVERCEQELIRCVGPIATFVLEEALAQSSQIEPRRLIEILAKQIPDVEKAKQFRQKFY